MAGIHIAVHGGAGGSSADNDGCAAAAQAAVQTLASGHGALDAAIAAVVVLEDDGRFNAGRGSVLCLDGYTVEMDAAVMDTRGRLGAVACIREVKNPVRAAHALTLTSHHFVAGEGATRFAHIAGCEMRDESRTAAVIKKHALMLKELQGKPGADTAASMRRYWNY